MDINGVDLSISEICEVKIFATILSRITKRKY